MFNTISTTFKSVHLAAAALGLAVFSFAAPTTAQAEQYNMCQWTDIPTSVLERITNRADFPGILEQMFAACPESALALTDAPTGSVDDGPDGRDTAGDRVNSEERPTPTQPERESPREEERECCDSPGDDESNFFGGPSS